MVGVAADPAGGERHATAVEARRAFGRPAGLAFTTVEVLAEGLTVDERRRPRTRREPRRRGRISLVELT